MTKHELPLMFPSVLDGSCPLSVFADAVEDCELDGDLCNKIRHLNVLEFGDEDKTRSKVTVFRIGVSDKPLMDEWAVAINNNAPEQMLRDMLKDAHSACRKLAVHWVKWHLGVSDVECDECEGIGKIHRPYPGGWDKCERCNGEGVIGQLKEEKVSR